MPEKDQENNSGDFYCIITKAIFFEPMSLSCKHIFEKEALENWLENKQNCPLCRQTITKKNEMCPADTLKEKITDNIRRGNLNSADQYVPMHIFLDLLIDEDKNESTALKKTHATLVEHREYQKKTNKGAILSYAIEKRPKLLAYLLWSKKLTKEIIKTYLCSHFNKTTINEYITKQIGDVEHRYSVAYWLFSELQGRKILEERPKVFEIVGKTLSRENLNFIPKDNPDHSILYYLLIDKIGHKMLKQYPALKDNLSEDKLSLKIDNGPHDGKIFRDLYENIFSNESKPALRT